MGEQRHPPDDWCWERGPPRCLGGCPAGEAQVRCPCLVVGRRVVSAGGRVGHGRGSCAPSQLRGVPVLRKLPFPTSVALEPVIGRLASLLRRVRTSPPLHGPFAVRGISGAV